MEECRSCEKWREHCRKFEEHFYWDHVDARKMHFFKSMTGDFSNCMIIPKKFIDHFQGELHEILELKVPSGEVWHVGLKKTYDGVVLECGWKDFVEAHGIQENDTLVFKYDGRSSFLVLMFDQSGCEKAASHFSKKMVPKFDLCARSPRKEVRHSSYVISHRHSDQVLPLTVDHEFSTANRNAGEEQVKLRSRFGRAIKRKALFTDSMKKRSSIESITEGKHNATSEVSPDNQRSPKDIFFSRQLRLSDAERNKAISFAETIQTDKPSFVLVLVPSNIFRRCFLTIPIAFAVEHLLPRPTRRFLLQLPDGKRSWPVRCIVQGHAVGLSSGWREFVHDNRLKTGDVCLFEVEFKNGIEMTVHISRFEEVLIS
ncbi:hypothetical protein HPP92_019639 [Vanilla planifolia]|nr:hypothetical protein HPP92_019639 [Vanilla planifolia]